MNKFKIGVWVIEEYDPEDGGGFSYYTQVMNYLKSIDNTKYEIIFIGYKINNRNFNNNITYLIKNRKYKFSKIDKVLKIADKILSFFFNRKYFNLNKKINRKNELIRNELKNIVDLIYYPTPRCEIENFPYIFTLWDLGHLSTYAFPEIAMNGNFENRNNFHQRVLFKALLVICESQAGKRELMKYCCFNENRIRVLPMFTSEIINDSVKLSKPMKIKTNDFFIHYPAQFWSHKNHYNLILAFEILIKNFPDLKLILTGSDKGNLNYILELIKEKKFINSIIYLGFIEASELKWIYFNSKCMVMPTLLGPTNIPLLESANLNCPVACSDLEGHREQLGEYANYFDPLDPQSIANSVSDILLNKNRKKYFEQNNSIENLNNLFLEAISIRNCWGKEDNIF